MVVDCELVREGLSARLDGEALPAGVDRLRLEGHVTSCAGCRAWLADAEELGAEWRPSPAPELSNLTGLVLEAVRMAGPWRSRRGASLVLRAALVLVAATELAVTVPVLVLGHDREAPLHVAHETGSFGLAIAIGLLAAALRPRLAAGTAWLVTTAAASLVVTAGLDLGRGLTTWRDEAPHLVVVAGAVLLWAMTRLDRGGADGAPETADGESPPTAAIYPLRLLYRGRTTHRPFVARKERRAS